MGGHDLYIWVAKKTDSLFLIIIMKNSHLLISFIFLCLITGLFGKKPNIVIVITDDQGVRRSGMHGKSGD